MISFRNDEILSRFVLTLLFYYFHTVAAVVIVKKRQQINLKNGTIAIPFWGRI